MKKNFSLEDIIKSANDIVIVTEAFPIDEPGQKKWANKYKVQLYSLSAFSVGCKTEDLMCITRRLLPSIVILAVLRFSSEDARNPFSFCGSGGVPGPGNTCVFSSSRVVSGPTTSSCSQTQSRSCTGSCFSGIGIQCTASCSPSGTVSCNGPLRTATRTEEAICLKIE